MKPILTGTIFILTLFTLFPAAAGADTARGVVFEDRNGNGHLDKGERGLSGVLVSSETGVVKTGRRGSYELPIDGDGDVIFVIQPAGYRAPLGENDLPRFYYVHRPNGSRPSRFPGLDPTGGLPESIDFPLTRVPVKKSFDVLVFSDPQVARPVEIGYLRDDVLAELTGADIELGITVGDIMYDHLDLFGRYNQVVAAAGIPFYHAPGNHDMNYDSPGDRHALETFQRLYGPAYYAFEIGQVSFIMLDTVEWLGPEENRTNHYQGRLGGHQLRWLQSYLAHVPADRLIVMAMHIPFYFAHNDHERVNVADRAELFKLLEKHRHLLAVTGHMHQYEYTELGPEQDWPGPAVFPQVICAAASGSWWSGPWDERAIPFTNQQDGTPNGYHIFHFEGNKWSQTYKAAGFGADFQLRISTPRSRITATEADTTELVVNVFAGHKYWTVEASVDGDGFAVLEQKVGLDPYVSELVRINPEGYPDWFLPEPTSHLWHSPLPSGLEPGVHSIRVRATDKRGRTFTAGRVFEIE